MDLARTIGDDVKVVDLSASWLETTRALGLKTANMEAVDVASYYALMECLRRSFQFMSYEYLPVCRLRCTNQGIYSTKEVLCARSKLNTDISDPQEPTLALRQSSSCYKAWKCEETATIKHMMKQVEKARVLNT